MPITLPIDPTRPEVSNGGARSWTGVVSGSNSYRSFGTDIFVPARRDQEHDNLWWPVTLAAAITNVIVPVEEPWAYAAVLEPPCEISDAWIYYGDLPVAEVNARLTALGYVVRESVLPPGQAAEDVLNGKSGFHYGPTP